MHQKLINVFNKINKRLYLKNINYKQRLEFNVNNTNKTKQNPAL
jgi:hypothetical protein